MILIAGYPPLTLDEIAGNIWRVAAVGLVAVGILLALFLIADLLGDSKGNRP